MISLENQQPGSTTLPSASPARIWISTVRYLLARAALIALTIFIGVYATVLIVSQPSRGGLRPAQSPFEISLEQQIDRYLRANYYGGATDLEIRGLRDQLRAEAGLNLPYLTRHLLWTYKALTFDWGRLTVVSVASLDFGRGTTAGARDIVLQYLPNTLLLIGSAYLVVFVVGLPLSLYLARHHGHRLDAILTLLWPLSSIPSWVIAVLLVALFAVQLRWFPISGMFDAHKPDEPLQYALTLARHMVLPVSALVLSLLFQLVYTWRAFFAVHAGEDYVELGRAKGLPAELLERRYVLRPTLPYVITSFTLTLIGFWQMSMALEVVFQWPGLGWLYITKALPNFWGESIYPGELIVAVGIVVIFAYALGIVVFLLDLVYAIVDPRIHLLPATASARPHAPAHFGRWSPRWFLSSARSTRDLPSPLPATQTVVRTPRRGPEIAWRQMISTWQDRTAFLTGELRRSPGAVLGLAIIAALAVGSVIAVTAYPYAEISRLWNGEHLSGRVYVPRLAAPAWTGLFAASPQLSSLAVNENAQTSGIQPSTLSEGWSDKTTVLSFDYPYGESPSEIFLYLDATYAHSPPFVSLEWIYPDGRQLKLKDAVVPGSMSYGFEKSINSNQLVTRFPDLGGWYGKDPVNPVPFTRILFGESASKPAGPMFGTYQLVVKSLLFEPGSDVRAELVLLGKVYGAAGTDYWRRELIIPLLWGMPFALVFGLLGAGTASLLAMLAAAAGTWLSGWVDAVVQRFTEINMVLPVLAIGVLASALWDINLWLILGTIVLLSAFGAPVKTFRSAFLQIKEAPYIEAARAYGASSARIITRYLVPRILPVLIPQLVILVPSFVFLEATLGLFNIKSVYPTWGTVISEGLSKGALYGSRFWVLEPISLLLLTGLAFALMGSASERIFNPRLAESAGGPSVRTESVARAVSSSSRVGGRAIWSSPAIVALVLICLLSAALMIYRGRAFLGALTNKGIALSQVSGLPAIQPIVPVPVNTPSPVPTKLDTAGAVAATGAATSLVPTLPADWATKVVWDPSRTLVPTGSRPAVYVLRRGEFPYCIARRFDVDPIELLALNDASDRSTFYVGMVLRIPQVGQGFPGRRMLQAHPTIYTVTAPGMTLPGVACVFGDVEPLAIARANDIAEAALLSVGQQLNIP